MTNHKQLYEFIGKNGWPAVRSATCGLMLVCGLVFSGMTSAAWSQTYNVIHNFTGGQDGSSPFTGLTIDAGGHIYGTAFSGGAGFGTVFTLANAGSGWVLTPVYTFAGGSDGEGPVSRLTIGPDGLLYGTTSAGGGATCDDYNGNDGCGTVYRLRPSPRAPSSFRASWSSNVLYRFSGADGAYPQGELTFDQAGNIYGTTVNGGSPGWGVVYSLTPTYNSWTQNVLYQAANNGKGDIRGAASP